MKKRRVQLEELKQMKKAVFVWHNEIFEDTDFAWSIAEFTVTGSTIENTDPRHIIHASSFEEIMLKANTLFPCKSVFTVDDIDIKMKSLAPHTSRHVVRRLWLCHA